MNVSMMVNQRTIIHKNSGGITLAFPDICKTPTPLGSLPIPYPNLASASTAAYGSHKVKCDGQAICLQTSQFASSSGDEAGVDGGIASGTNTNCAEFVSYSLDTKIEGKYVVRALDLMLHNKKNTVPTPVVQTPVTLP